MKYKKNENAALDADFAAADWYGNVRVGKDNIFYRRFMNLYYIPVGEIERAYRRVEEVKGRTGCCSNDFSIHRLILIQRDGTETVIKIGEEMYRHEPEKLIETIRNRFPSVAIGRVITAGI